jgi:uncharacterized membrane protein
MASLELLLSLLHVMSFVVWLGGGIFSALVVFPSLSLIKGDENKKFLGAFHSKVTKVYWISLVLLLSSGLYRAWIMGALDIEYLLLTIDGQFIFIKILFGLTIVAIGSVITFHFLPKLKNKESTPVGLARTEKKLGLLSLVNIIIGVTAIYLGLSLRTS